MRKAIVTDAAGRLLMKIFKYKLWRLKGFAPSKGFDSNIIQNYFPVMYVKTKIVFLWWLTAIPAISFPVITLECTGQIHERQYKLRRGGEEELNVHLTLYYFRLSHSLTHSLNTYTYITFNTAAKELKHSPVTISLMFEVKFYLGRYYDEKC